PGLGYQDGRTSFTVNLSSVSICHVTVKVTEVGLISPRFTHRTLAQGMVTVTVNGSFFSPRYGSVGVTPSLLRGAVNVKVTWTSSDWRFVSPAAIRYW